MTWGDDKSQKRPLADGARAGTLQIAGALIGAIFIVSLVLYGLNHEGKEDGSQKTTAPITVTPQPAPGQRNSAQGQQPPGPQQAQSQQGGGAQPSAPNSTATQPSGPSNPSTTTGQGPNAQGSQNGKASNKANQTPVTASPSAPPPNPANN